MGNRILKESICTSDEIDKLTPFEETFFCRLIVNCDDYGVMDARPAILKARLYPLKSVKEVSEKLIVDTRDKLCSAGLIKVYYDGDHPYLQMLTWADHQRLRNSKRKYPLPEDCENSPQVAADCGLTRAGAESESESESNTNQNTNTNVCAEQAPAPPVITLPLNDGTQYPVIQTQVDEWVKLYPAVDVMQQLRNMRGWLDSKPERRKTLRGIKAFITRWLSTEQDKGRAAPQSKPGIPDEYRFGGGKHG